MSPHKCFKKSNYFSAIFLKSKLEIQTRPNSSEFLEKLERREKMLLNNTTFLASLYLDPRLQCILSKDPLKVMCARTHLKELIVRILRLEKQINNNQFEDLPSTSKEALGSSPDVFPSSVNFCDTSQPRESLLGQYLNTLIVDREQENEENDNDDEKKLSMKSIIFLHVLCRLISPFLSSGKQKKNTLPLLIQIGNNCTVCSCNTG
ncbi:uncharacterized protein LOC124421430 [Lucilia cuprina]|uniref:uncharacterized protein LOC124421430 n=1 Tax=Lucilia cuprina TaxID=7375 RepID=UPI001F0509F8|nr:uncharacterized protein LOC124421430 [Lucilia cuprina]